MHNHRLSGLWWSTQETKYELQMVLRCWGQSPWSKSTRNSVQVEEAVFVKVYFASLGLLPMHQWQNFNRTQVNLRSLMYGSEYLQLSHWAHGRLFSDCKWRQLMTKFWTNTCAEVTQVLDSIAWGGPLCLWQCLRLITVWGRHWQWRWGLSWRWGSAAC